eukprot:g3710.t1
MQFLLKATKESRGKKKIRHLLILACRTLGIAALAFAAARPVVSGLIGWGAGSVDTVILILDRSASMELQSAEGQAPKREIVLRKVRETIEDLGSPRLVLIDSASATPQEVPSPDVLAEISATAPTDTAADIPSLLTKAIEYLGTSSGSSEIWLASDLQSSNWHPDGERWAAVRASITSLQSPPAIRILALSENSVPNTSLRLLGTRRNAESLTLDLEATRGEAERGQTRLPLSVNINGAGSSESITLPGQSLRFQKRIEIPDRDESGYGWLSIPADGNPRDNSVFFAYGPARPVNSIVISPPGEAADYLELAAAPPGFEKQSARRSSPAEFRDMDTSGVSLIIWAAPLPEKTSSDILESFVTSGGQVVFVPSASDSATEFLGMKWEPVTLAEAGKFFILQDWDRVDGPLRDGLDGTQIPAERLRAIKRAIPSGDATPLARWEDGEPFLTRKVFNRGTVWFIGSAPDYTWSNLGDADVLLPAVQRILALGTERFDASYLTEVGSDATNAASGLPAPRIDSHSTDSGPYSAGVFRIDDRLLAVNRPASEDDPEITDKENLDAMLEGTDFRLLDQAIQSPGTSGSADFWRIFLLAMMFFLISEAILCLPRKSKQTSMAGNSPFGAAARH